MNSSSTFNFMARAIVVLLASLSFSMQASAHTGLKESTPADESVVTSLPAKLDLVFTAEVKLIKLELMGVGHEMPTNFEVSDQTKAAYSIETPGMHPGKFTVNWAVIGADGHTVTNSYSFEVKPES
ncbi:MAG: copper resistance protein CopC [Gammaproteobacteria bacterium]|jgi:hypothetical protein|nr:copper resistance protein CopC [Gammaproteobacteria bacterium]MBT3859629.1 copper resistance protein CopC [Gammaproteobacteria bacterium]MBT3986477.1 copper resistance protein CopC [Gammaproteobacteria bacterium]MBT4256786.1 copper resistance protein CopC [Gammaproteobacteria bacterium]MBT4582164.1 copper resistance protein CopC [Gammaproteobacteria bacterium]